jgi:methionine-rich copper-binding protein CopC
MIVALFLATAGLPASAHTALVGSSPTADETVTESPDALTLSFTEEVVPVRVTLYDADGTEVDGLGEPEEDGDTLRVPVSAPLDDGAYKLVYRVVSDDAHTVEGEITFTVETAE